MAFRNNDINWDNQNCQIENDFLLQLQVFAFVLKDEKCLFLILSMQYLSIFLKESQVK